MSGIFFGGFFLPRISFRCSRIFLSQPSKYFWGFLTERSRLENHAQFFQYLTKRLSYAAQPCYVSRPARHVAKLIFFLSLRPNFSPSSFSPCVYERDSMKKKRVAIYSFDNNCKFIFVLGIVFKLDTKNHWHYHCYIALSTCSYTEHTLQY